MKSPCLNLLMILLILTSACGLKKPSLGYPPCPTEPKCPMTQSWETEHPTPVELREGMVCIKLKLRAKDICTENFKKKWDKFVR